jgi:Tol biopolymer transport system component
MARGRSAGITVVFAASVLAAGAASAQLPLTEPAPKARVAFVADNAIHTITADGSDRRRVTAPAGELIDADPAWAPGGGPIAFGRLGEDEDHEDQAGIWLVQPDGSGLRRLSAQVRPGRNEYAPAWSPDGSRIAFVRTRVGRDRFSISIVSSAADGSDQRSLYSEAGDFDDEDLALLYAPAWSPAGDRILFTRSAEGLAAAEDTRPSLHVVPAAGGKAQLLARDALDGTWSPDGARIAFAGVQTGRACEGRCEFSGDVQVMNADGSGRMKLTDTPTDETEPSWSGDGGWIAFHSDRNSVQAADEDSPPELYAIRPDGSCLTWLTNGTAHSRSPSYEPGAGLDSDPGACGPTARDPLVETDTREAERHRGFPLWWLGRVAPNGLLLTRAEVSRNRAWFGYHDCGRFDPAECGEFVNVENRDLCVGGRPLAGAGHRKHPVRLARGALLHERRDAEFGSLSLFTGRTWIHMDTASGTQPDPGVVDGLHRFGQAPAPGSAVPSTRLPLTFWKTLTRVSAAHRRLKDVDAVADRLRLGRGEVKRRLTLSRRLGELGVKRRLGCGR